MQLRLASYNVHKCVGLDRKGIPSRTITILNALDADIVALQEVDFRLGRRNAALPRLLIEQQTRFAIAPFAVGHHSLGWHGQTILVRKDWEIATSHRLPLPGLEPRGAIIAEISFPDGAIRVVGVHLGLMRRFRLLQLAAIRAELNCLSAMPTVIIGDFNEWSSAGGAEALAPDFRLHSPGRSFPAVSPIAALDRTALGCGAHIVNAGVYRHPPARVASDHLPIWTDIRL